MTPFKTYIARQLLGKKLHFKCDCTFKIDTIGTIKDFKIIKNEILFIIDTGNRIVKIGENHPNLTIEEV